MTLRFANIGGRSALVNSDGTRYLDLETASNGAFSPDPMDAFARWDALRSFHSGLAASALDTAQPIDAAQLGAPSPMPYQVFGIGLNYRTHAEESGMPIPTSPLTFTKFTSSIAAPNADITLGTSTVDWEVELVVVISSGGRDISIDHAWNHVAGVAVGQDISDRTLQFATQPPQFNLGKSRRGYSPFGPWLVDASSLADRDRLHMSMTLNGEKVQDTLTDDLIFDVPTIISYLSTIVELLPGDVIYSGTPGGVGMSFNPPRFLKPGDVIVSTIDGIGTTTNHCV
ncbi:MAG: fumarylacetoacetate hydrolase family protein [Actinomycetota bacterium]